MKIPILLFIVFSYLIPASSQTADTRFHEKVHTTDGQRMPYRLFTPTSYDSTQHYPLVLWLHGARGRGTDNVQNISGNNSIGSHVWIHDSIQTKHPCFVLSPQCPDTSLWVANEGIDSPPDQLDIAMSVLKDVMKNYRVDPLRVYVVGQSMGGIAVWEAIGRYPELFAAALPLCGMGNTAFAPRMKDVAVWAFHGEADKSVPVSHSREMVQAITKAGGKKAKLTTYSGVGHEVWNVAFKEAGLFEWVFEQKR